ncbi:heparinase II/III family protein, partial [Cutibacterium acnes]
MSMIPKYGGHFHYDPLNLTLYANDQELLPDIGYTHTFYNMWAMSTLAHNTVVVDSANMSASNEAKDGGNIESFAPVDSRVQVARASQPSAYPQTEEYSREPWYIGFDNTDDGEGYLLDLFRVAGGSRHEYTLQGDANLDAYFESDLVFEEYGPYLLP